VTLPNEIAAFLRFYPQIYFACHRRHVRDPKTRRTLSLNQASILDHLDGVEPTNLRSLARHMGVTASTMSLNVDRLERAGYMRRERSRSDARQIELRLTETGARFKQQQKVLDPELVGSLLKRLPGRDRAGALRGLELLAEAANEMITDRQMNNRRAQSAGGKTKRNPL
jgi:MarR family transcriptional regulator, organic hydroperoxide resistance regulator